MKRGKIAFYNWDFINAKDDTVAIPICLTWAERQILLTMVDYIGWQTRWVSTTGTVSLDQIERWRDSITYKLMGECPVDCAEVIACITTGLTGDADLILALQLWLQQNINLTTTYPPDGQGMIPIAYDNLNVTGCDNDEMFGFALQLVQFTDRAITDCLEIIEVITNSVELMSAMSEIAPSLTTVPDLVSYMVDNVAENYHANYDEELENKIACGLFCLMLKSETCSITWAEITDYISVQLAYELEDVTLADWATYVVEGVWDGDEFVYIMFLTFFAVLSIGGDWTGITLKSVQQIITSFFNDPNPDWATLCECPYDNYYLFDDEFANGWTVVQGDWLGTGNPNLYSVNTGGICQLKIDRNFTGFDGLQSLYCNSCNYDHGGYSTTGAGWYVYIIHGSGTYSTNFALTTPSMLLDLPTTLNGVTYISVAMVLNTVGEDGSCRIDGIGLAGVGDEPPPDPTEPA
jgi:hypothetical protein